MILVHIPKKLGQGYSTYFHGKSLGMIFFFGRTALYLTTLNKPNLLGHGNIIYQVCRLVYVHIPSYFVLLCGFVEEFRNYSVDGQQ